MDKEVAEILSKIYSYIRTNVFVNKVTLMRNLKAMKYNTDLMWFNIALISRQHRSDLGQVVVDTIEHWKTRFNSDFELIDENTDAVKLISPQIISKEKPFDTLKFNLIDTFFFTDLKINHGEKIKFIRKSSVALIIEEYKNYFDLLKILREDWQTVFITTYLEQFDFYYLGDEQLKNYYITILKYVFSEELKIEKIDAFGPLKREDVDYIYIYKNLVNAISSFHIAFNEYLTALSEIFRVIDIDIDKEVNISIGYQKLCEMRDGNLEQINKD